jgi:hypothetical protein
MRGEELFPDVRLKLLDAQRQTVVIGIDVQDDRVDFVAFLQNFRGMFDATRGNIGNVHKPVDSLFHFYERAEIRQIAHAA